MPVMTFRARKTRGGGWNAVLSLPTLPGACPPGFPPGSPLRIKATERPSKAAALEDAASLAARLAANPLLAAMLPPGTAQAVAITEQLAKAAKLGKLSKVASKLVGKGAKRLAKKLKFW